MKMVVKNYINLCQISSMICELLFDLSIKD